MRPRRSTQAGTFDRPEHFRTIPLTRIQYGFLLKQLRFHDYMSGRFFTLAELLAYLRELPNYERFAVHSWLEKEELI